MSAYQSYKANAMNDYVPTDEELEKGFATLPKL